MRETLEILLGLVQVGTWAMLAAASVQLARTAAWTFRAGRIRPGGAAAVPDDAPAVTVQLPLRNERGRAEGLMRCIASLDWPRNRLEIQVLDDSDDDTIGIVDRTSASLRTEGHDIVVIRRDVPRGFKAGALANGLSTARGQYVAIFDADARPSPDCLRRLFAALIADPRLAYVQARWSFDNESEGLLQRTQAAILDALFVGEQARLSALGRPVQFNGTGGLWRRVALDDAGGWLGDDGAAASVTEDLALSFRLGLVESFGATRPDISLPTELPMSVAAFRRQQARWVRGAGETLRALLRAIARGKNHGAARATMLGHLLRHTRQPWLLLLAVLWPATYAVTPRFAVRGAWPCLVGATAIAMGLYFAGVRRRLGRNIMAALLFAPVVMSLSVGLCVSLTGAFIGGVSGRAGAFERTPKGGGYRAEPGGAIELALGVVYTVLAGLAVLRGSLVEGLSLAWFFAFGFLWVGSAAFGR